MGLRRVVSSVSSHVTGLIPSSFDPWTATVQAAITAQNRARAAATRAATRAQTAATRAQTAVRKSASSSASLVSSARALGDSVAARVESATGVDVARLAVMTNMPLYMARQANDLRTGGVSGVITEMSRDFAAIGRAYSLAQSAGSAATAVQSVNSSSLFTSGMIPSMASVPLFPSTVSVPVPVSTSSSFPVSVSGSVPVSGSVDSRRGGILSAILNFIF